MSERILLSSGNREICSFVLSVTDIFAGAACARDYGIRSSVELIEWVPVNCKLQGDPLLPEDQPFRENLAVSRCPDRHALPSLAFSDPKDVELRVSVRGDIFEKK